LRIADLGPAPIININHQSSILRSGQLHVEARSRWADRIAYNRNDLEDGVGRLIDGNQMRHLDLYAEAAHRVAVERIPDWTIRRTRVAKTIIDRSASGLYRPQPREYRPSRYQATAQHVCTKRRSDCVVASIRLAGRRSRTVPQLRNSTDKTLVAAAEKVRTLMRLNCSNDSATSPTGCRATCSEVSSRLWLRHAVCARTHRRMTGRFHAHEPLDVA
jgi:dGTP triphosphohydrolase